MSFQPIPYLDCYVCEIEILATNAITTVLTPINLGNILVDTGGQISISTNYITFPANMEFFIKANVVCLNDTDVNASATPAFFDASTSLLQYQAIGNSPSRTGTSSGFWFSSIDCFMMLFSSASARSARLSLSGAAGAYPISIPYNNATTYIPNSTITILYKAI